jgi:NitT/TauT family transport system permease protein
MRKLVLLFKPGQPTHRLLSWGDLVVLVIIAVLIYSGVRLAFQTPSVIEGPQISLAPTALPWYAVLSVGRVFAAYGLSLLFTFLYGSAAARNRRAEQILLPLLDVLQSVPILSFLPVVLLSFSAILPARAAAELASIVLIFTSQVWNLTFAWYQALKTIPTELCEVSTAFGFTRWMRFRVLELPFAALSLIWNSMMSWAGGWFFLMASETFTVGERDFRLPGLGTYIQEAVAQADPHALAWGIGALIAVIVLFDQLLWRPLLAWADRFKMEMVTGERPPRSWFYEALRSSRLVRWLGEHWWRPMVERLETSPPAPDLTPQPPSRSGKGEPPSPFRGGVGSRGVRLGRIVWGLFGVGLAYGAYRAGEMLLRVSAEQWGMIVLGLGATLVRVSVALGMTLAWTIPAGVFIGMNPRWAAYLQPLAQIAASVPATAFFPIVALFFLEVPGGLNIAAIVLMLMGTQWYLLFNVIAGAAAIPQDLKYTTVLLHLGRWERWRTLILPALFPYIITGAITASGGAWNASIVAEYIEFGDRTVYTLGVGAVIARATTSGDYPLLLAATLSMVVTVVLINRFFWRRLYRLAEEHYRFE